MQVNIYIIFLRNMYCLIWFWLKFSHLIGKEKSTIFKKTLSFLNNLKFCIKREFLIKPWIIWNYAINVIQWMGGGSHRKLLLILVFGWRTLQSNRMAEVVSIQISVIPPKNIKIEKNANLGSFYSKRHDFFLYSLIFYIICSCRVKNFGQKNLVIQLI